MPDLKQPIATSISLKIIILLALCLTCIIALSAGISFLLKRHELIRERNIHAGHSVERLAFTMSAPLWNYDLEQLTQLASAELSGENSYGVMVWTPDGRLLLEKMRDPDDIGLWSGPDGALAKGKQPAGMLVVQHDIRRDQQLLGTVKILYDNRQVNKSLVLMLTEEFFKALALLVTTSLALYVGLSRVFLKRLKTVYDAARALGSGDLSGRIEDTSRDELGTLAKTFNQMSNRIGVKINQLEKALDEIRQLKSVRDDILNSLPSIIVMVNKDLEIVLWNKQAELYTGVSSSAASGCNAAVLLPDFAGCLQHTGAVLDSQQPYEIEKHVVQKGDTALRYSVQMLPLVSENNRQVVMRADDITEQARLEEIMVQNEKMTMVGGLAAGMAHEINNPLAAILQNTQNIERRILADLPANRDAADQAGISLSALGSYMDQRGIPGFILHIKEAGVRISKIINNLLRFSSKGESPREQVTLESVMEQTLELAASDYEMKKQYDFAHIVIIREYAPQVQPVLVAISEIEHVLLNILKNAAQAASSVRESRPPQIILRTRNEGQMSVLEIEDNGPGMKDTIQRRIFEPFYSTRDVGEGAGLGLSVSYAIISNSYHGRIEVESLAGAGTCFSISIPANGGVA